MTIESDKVESAVKAFVQLVTELSELGASFTSADNNSKIKKTLVSIDVMSILSSILLLSSSMSIEDKVDQLFEWVSLSGNGEDGEPVTYEQFYLGLTSFEKGDSSQ